MTLRAFLLGLFLAGLLAYVESFSAYGRGWGGFTGSAFPTGAVLVLVVLTLALNGIIRLIRRGWVLKHPELMLIWCMVTVAGTFPDMHGRFIYSAMACGPYMARRPDLAWEDNGALANAPQWLVLSKDPKSVAARQYYEGSSGRVPWRYWVRPLGNWCIFFTLVAIAVFCMAGIVRRQWLESERLMFPLARVPLEFSEGSGEGGWLPNLFREKGFQLGLALTLGFRFVRALPLFFGSESTVSMAIPMRQIFALTPLSAMSFDDIDFWPQAVGFAFLVPADVSLSVWFFYWVARWELQVASWMRLSEYGGNYGHLMGWQQAGAYIAFTVGLIIMARRHLKAVLLKALCIRPADDSDEPVGYRLGAWGLFLSLAGCVVWYILNGMNLLGAVLALAFIMCWNLVYARMVAQAGLYSGRTIWQLPRMTYALSGGHGLTAPGAVIVSLQDTLYISGSSGYLAPMAINAFRIAEVFKKGRRRLLMPILLFTFVVAMVISSYSALKTAYTLGGLNLVDSWAAVREPQWRYAAADNIIRGTGHYDKVYWGPLAMGIGGMSVMMFLRSRFYWWPIHGVGLLACSSWNAHRLWLPFFLGWATKMSIMKFTGGRTLRSARYFFIAVILSEATVGGFSAALKIITRGATPGF